MSTENQQKPKIKLIGEETTNIHNLVAIFYTALKNAGQTDKANEMRAKVSTCTTRQEAIDAMKQYVDTE